MARIDTTFSGQDFLIPITATAAAQTHVFSRATQTSLEPRVIRGLDRLSIDPLAQAGVRGLLQKFSVSGHPLILTPGPGSVTGVLAGSERQGFPGRALDPRAMVDLVNLLGVFAGPDTPVEMQWWWSQAQPLYGMIGASLPPPELFDEIKDALSEGDLFGEENFALGGGEVQQANANTLETITIAYKAPRAMFLERLIVDTFRSNNASVQAGDILLQGISIAGTPLFATSQSVDTQLLSPYSTDEDGLQINQQVGADTLIELEFQVAALGAGVSGIIQHGFFAS